VIYLKPGPNGPSMKGIQPEILAVIPIAHAIVQQWGKDLIITTGTDGVHMKGSKHYEGLALDLRTRHLIPAARVAFSDELTKALGREYDVVLHKSHLHVEFDPEEGS
jgi:hypothetical protein